jgi:UDP-N-acetylmuramoyl-tripeptide--D-alanyl-D-alanine ligase
MQPVELRKIVEVASGDWVAQAPPADLFVVEMATDSRILSKPSVFVALRGEKMDGHAYVLDARKKGAVASIVSRSRLGGLPAEGGPYIAVDDPLDAYERIARWNRDRLSLQVIGVTGSVGKTSTKEFLATVLGGAFQVKAAPKSYNNRIGVAATLLSATGDTEVLVVELGTSARGELSHLSSLARLHKVVLTEIAPAHLAGFGGMEALVEAKAEVFDGLQAGGPAFIKHSVRGFEVFASRAKGPVRTFGWKEGDYAVTDCQRVLLGHDSRTRSSCTDYGYHFTLNGTENFLLPVPGRHNVLNATAAMAVARDLGMDWAQIRSALASCRLPPLRLQVDDESGIVFVDDSYNANPASMEAAIDEWVSIAAGMNGKTAAVPVEPGSGGHLVAVLGDMLEMGDQSRTLHERIGRKLCGVPARLIVTVGSDSRHIGEALRAEGGACETAHFESAASVVPFLKTRLRQGDKVLFKASRRIGLDTAVLELRRWAAAGGVNK